MKLRNLVSAIAAAALAVTTAISVSAEKVAVDPTDAKYVSTYSNGISVNLYQYDSKTGEKTGYCADTDFDITAVYGFKMYLKLNPEKADTAIGGGIAYNSNTTGWTCVEWASAENVKPITMDAKDNSITLIPDEKKPMFTAGDEYYQVHVQYWWGGTVELEKVELLGKRGKVLVGYAEAPAATEPAATEPAATEPAATEPAATEPAATEPAATEPAATEPAATEPAETEPVVTEPTAEPTVEPTAEPTEEPAPVDPVTEEPAATTPAEGGSTGAADDKGNPDTGVEGIAIVAGLAAVAGVAFAVSRKRK